MTPKELEAILNGSHGDPFSVLGPHQSGGAGKCGRSFRRPWMRGWRMAASHPMRKTAFRRLLCRHGGAASRRIQAATHALERRDADMRRPVPLSAAALRIRSAHARRGHPLRELPDHGRAPRGMRGSPGRPLCRLGAERGSGERGGRFQRLGRTPACHAPAHRRRLGNFPSGRRRGHQLQVFRSFAVRGAFASRKRIPTASPRKCRRNRHRSCAISTRTNGTTSSGWKRALRKTISKSRSRSTKCISVPGCAVRTIRI